MTYESQLRRENAAFAVFFRDLADPVEMKLLHMITADPKRTPTFVLFAHPYFWLSSGPAKCGGSCVSEPPGGEAWNHGDVLGKVNTTWPGLVGPGVSHFGAGAAGDRLPGRAAVPGA